MESVMHSEVDFNQNGKHCGYIRLPHSVHRSAYGWIPLPVASIKNGAGPKVVLSAGVHGDEYEGQIILNQLIRQLEPEQISGQVIILPMANFPAAEAGLRTSPLDDLNLNRIFPGNAQGTPTEMIAHYMETVIMKEADYYIDIHSGGSSLEYLPVALYSESDWPDTQQRQQLVLDSLGLPYALGLDESRMAWYTTSAAQRNAACAVTIELGGNGQVNSDYVVMFQESLRRMLSAVGCLNEKVTASEVETRYVKSSQDLRVYAYSDGLFEPLVRPGDEVALGDLVAYLHDPSTPGSDPVAVLAGADGMVICYRVLTQVRRGDCLFELVA